MADSLPPVDALRASLAQAVVEVSRLLASAMPTAVTLDLKVPLLSAQALADMNNAALARRGPLRVFHNGASRAPSDGYQVRITGQVRAVADLLRDWQQIVDREIADHPWVSGDVAAAAALGIDLARTHSRELG